MIQSKFLLFMLSLEIFCNASSSPAGPESSHNFFTGRNAAIVFGIGAIAWIAHKSYKSAYAEEFTPADERRESTTGFYTLNGYANPASRCAAILAAILPGRTFVGNPIHTFPIYGLSLDTYTDRKGLEQFSRREDLEKKIVAGHSCGGADALNHLFKGTLPESIDGVIVVAPFAHTDDIIDSKLPSWVPKWAQSCARTAVSIVLWKYANNQPIENLQYASAQAKEKPTLIIACEGDLTVPNESTERLYKAMRDAGFNVTYKKFKNISGVSRVMIHDYAAEDNHTTIQDFVSKILPKDKSAAKVQSPETI